MAKLPVIVGMEGSEELVPEQGIEAEVVAGRPMMSGMERRRSNKTEDGNGTQPLGKGFDAGMSESTEGDIEKKEGQQPAKGHRIKDEKDEHEPTETQHLGRMEDKKTDRVRGLVSMVEAVDEGENPGMVREAMKGIHPEVHGQDHHKAIEGGARDGRGNQRDGASFPKPPAGGGNGRVQENRSEGGRHLDSTPWLPAIENPPPTINASQHQASHHRSRENDRVEGEKEPERLMQSEL